VRRDILRRVAYSLRSTAFYFLILRSWCARRSRDGYPVFGPHETSVESLYEKFLDFREPGTPKSENQKVDESHFLSHSLLTMKILLILVLCFSAQAADLSRFLNAIAKVESGGNAKAINRKENALGMYQIRPGYFRDAKTGGKHSDVFDPKKAQEVVMAYFRKYEPEAVQKGNLEALARLHNAGPNWRKKKSATNEYWNKVKKSL